MIARREIISALETVAEVGVPTFEAARLLDVGTDQYLKYFQREIIDEVLVHGGSTCCFYEGAYGTGKTHLLQLFQNVATTKSMLVAWVELANDLNFSNWHSVTKRILEKIEYRTPNGTIQSLPKILEFLGRQNQDHRTSLKEHSLPHVGFVNAIDIYLKQNLTLEPVKKEKLVRYLLGDRITAGELRKSGINGVKNPLSQRNAEMVFKTVLSALHHLGFPGTLILIDEIDQTFQNVLRAPPRAQIAANLVRRLIDACSLNGIQGVCMVFAVSQDFIPRCSAVYPALGERLVVANDCRLQHGWRTPVIRLETVNTHADHQSFVGAAVDNFVRIAEALGLGSQIRQLLENCSREVMDSHAGLNYRRPLMRRFASILLQSV